MRLFLSGLVVSMVLATSAAADDYPGPPAVSFTNTGQAAVAWTLSDGPDAGVAIGRPGSLRTVRVHMGPVSPPSFGATGNVPSIFVVAQPGGGARLLWLAPSIDYSVPRPRYGSALRTMLVASDGTASPVQDVAAGAAVLSTATNARGDVLAAFAAGGDALLAEAPAGGSFTVTPAPVDGFVVVPALADNGAAAVASGTSVAIRPAGGAFGPPLAVPGLGDARALDIASDGTTVVADDNGAALRPAGGVFGEAAHGQSGNLAVSPVGVAAFDGSSGLFTQSEGPNRVFDLPGDGGAPVPRDTGSSDSFGAQVASREDGGALVARYHQLFARDVVGAFRGPLTLGQRVSGLGLALSAAGPLVATTSATAKASTVVVNGQQVASYPVTVTQTPPYVPAVVARRVTVHGRVARVPIRCVMTVCDGTLRTATGAAASFDIPDQQGRLVRIRVPAGAHRVRVTVTVRRPPGSAGQVAVVHARRHLLRGAPARVGCAAPWAERLATGDGATLWRLDGGRVLACPPGATPRVITGGPFGIDGPTAVNPHFAVVLDVTVGHLISSTIDLDRQDLATGATTPLRVQSSGDAPEHEVAKIGVTDSGAVVFADALDGYPRIRVLSETDDRILDAAPGIDPASLTVTGNRATWTRDGAQQRAELP